MTQTNGGPRVLLISDQQRLIDALVTALRTRWPKAEIRTAWNAATGVQLIVDCIPELVVLDADLPDRDGYDVLTGIRRSSDVPVVLLTGGGRWSYESRAQGSEATLRLPKPFSMEAVMGFARRVLDGDEPIPASGCAGNDGVVQPSGARMPDR